MLTSQSGLTHWADFVTVIVYFIFVLGIGIWSMYRKKRKNVESYFLAGRTMPWFAVGLSIFGSNIGSEHFVGLAGAGAANGIVLVLFELIPALLIQVMSWFYLPVFISAGVYTLPEYMGRRFGSVRLRTYLSVLTLCLHILTRLVGTIFSGAIYIQLALRWNMYPSIIGLLFITAIFTVIGGLTAVMFTDTAQSIIMLIGSFIVMGVSLNKVGGYDKVAELYQNATPSTMNDSSTCGLPREDAFNLLRGFDSDFPWFSMVIQCGIASAYYFVCDQIMVQRCFAAKNISHAKAGTLVGGYLKILPLFIMVIPGMISRILYPDEVGCVDREVCQQVCDNAAGCSNIAYPTLVLELLPEGARGLLMAVMLSAIVTSLTSIFNSSSTVFTMDLWRRMRPNARQRELLLVGRGYVIVLCLITIAWIPVVKAAQGGQLFKYIVVVEGFVAAPMPILFTLAVFWDGITEKGAFLGLVLTHIVGVARLILEVVYPEPLCGDHDNRPDFLSKVHSFYYSEMLMVFQLVITIAISLCTERRTDKEIFGMTWSTRIKPGTTLAQMRREKKVEGEEEETEGENEGQFELTDLELRVDGSTGVNVIEQDVPMETLRQRSCVGHCLCETVCGLPDSSVPDIAIEITMENRIRFMTEISKTVSSVNNVLAILLLSSICFVIGFYR